MRFNSKFWSLFLGVLWSASPLFSATSILYDEIFNSSRTTQSLPSQAYWYNSHDASKITANSGSLSAVANSTCVNMAYFTSSGSPQTLNVGDSLVFTFSFTATGITNTVNGLRLAILNSGASRVSADGYGTGNALFTGYTGYGVCTDLGYSSTTESSLILRQSGSNTNLLSGGAYTAFGSTFAGANLTSSTTYTASYTITNNGSSMGLSYTINGNTYTATDSTYKYTSFDTIAIQLVSQATTVTFSEFEVAYVSAIPEPDFWIMGFLGIFGIILIDKKRLKLSIP